MHRQGQIKKHRKKVAEIDAELAHRANRPGGGCQPIELIEGEEESEAPEVQADQNKVDTEKDSVIMRVTTNRSSTSVNTTPTERRLTI